VSNPSTQQPRWALFPSARCLTRPCSRHGGSPSAMACHHYTRDEIQANCDATMEGNTHMNVSLVSSPTSVGIVPVISAPFKFLRTPQHARVSASHAASRPAASSGTRQPKQLRVTALARGLVHARQPRQPPNLSRYRAANLISIRRPASQSPHVSQPPNLLRSPPCPASASPRRAALSVKHHIER
jgi:hypothetical protein